MTGERQPNWAENVCAVVARTGVRNKANDRHTQRFAGEFSADGQNLRGQWKQFTDGEWAPCVSITLIKRA